ncbi:MAG: beta-lactamase family protein [Xanthomonadales bacterium]|nr:beta-lactamase family protein [Xanthomonadales bacterium]MBK7146589.1 beta-lactamase family protein [Xanthomonadales bacterium]MCC6560457.1 beta-lactamase family protein [Xanthomonadales bacterium]
MKRTGLALWALLAGPLAHAQSICSFADADARFEQLMQDQGLPGGAILIGDRQGLLHERYFGSHGAATVVPIASASKLVSGVRILQLIDDGRIDADAPVAAVLPQFTGDKATMSVAQMFSHTAGYGGDSGDPLVFDRTITLAEAVDQIACCRSLPAGFTVGGQFAYGGVSMHIAGRVAEVATGLDWEAGWQAELGVPLGIGSIDWQAFGATSNYPIAGGARSNLRDLGRLLHLLANDGRSNNRRLLSMGAADRLLVDRAAGLPALEVPPGVTPPVHYGLGAWIDGLGGPERLQLVHSLGAFGTMPWADFRHRAFGVFMIRGAAGINGAAIPAYREMLAAIEIRLEAGPCVWIERFDEIFVADFDAR